jgi:hypothetical protein
MCGCSANFDGQDDFDADKVYGGPNDDSSLTNYRIEFFDEFPNSIEIFVE